MIVDMHLFLSEQEQPTRLSDPSVCIQNGDRATATPNNIGSPHAEQGPASMPHLWSVALTTLQVLTYASDLRKRHEFWDHHSAIIHKKHELPAIEKFKYFLTYLTGAVKRAIEGMRLASTTMLSSSTHWKSISGDANFPRMNTATDFLHCLRYGVPKVWRSFGCCTTPCVFT